MSEERLVEIESKLAHQDQLLLDLNDAVALQQEKIMRLEALSKTLLDRVRAIGDALPGDAQDERPPHY
ncbi:MAG: SlyX family protein [Gammaproteobacteria bacterium]|nr:SlyX family protein [Gammaproteobacteria bacterium]